MHWIFLVVAVFISVIGFLVLPSDEKRLKRRKKQSSNRLRENVIKRRLDEVFAERVKYSRRHKVETLCMQAGLPLAYTELFLFSLGVGIVLAFVLGYAMNNFLMGILFLFIGFMMPKQIIVLIRNFRIAKVEKQIGSFINMTLKRYEVASDFGKAVQLSAKEFKGEEPVYTELKRLSLAISLGRPIPDALRDLERRIGNKYIGRLADYYEASGDVGSEESRRSLLNQAYEQYEENRKGQIKLKRELATIKRENYIMLGMIPVFALFQVFTNDDYIRFMTQEQMGQYGTAGIAAVFFGLLWFINNKIGAPLE